MKRYLAILAATAILPFASAQNIRPVTVHASNAPARQVLTSLFNQMDVRFRIDPDVKGRATVNEDRADFGETLFEVLDQCDAIAEFKDGAYSVRPIRHVKATGKGLGDQLPMVGYEQADVRLAVKELLGLAGLRYTLSPDVRGTVTVSLRNVTVEQTLQLLLRQVDSNYVFASGRLELTRRPLPIGADLVPPP